MSDSYVQVAPNSTGLKIQNYENTVNAQTVQAQAVTLVNTRGVPILGDSARLNVNIAAPLSAFGDVSSTQQTPVSQIDFVYGINTQLTATAVTASGAVTATAGLLSVSSGAAGTSSAQLTSRRYLKYRAGQGGLARFTGLFGTGTAGNKQYIGMGTPDLNCGLFFGYNGTAFGICHVSAASETWVNQTDWNVDNFLGAGGEANPSGATLNPQRGMPFQIRYQYLGFGAIQFFVENPTTGGFQLCHVIRYANANTAVNLSQPSMAFMIRSANTSNTSAIVVKTASAALFVEGSVNFLGVRHGFANAKNVSTQLSVFGILNCTTMNSVTNRAQLHLRSVSFGGANSSKTAGVITLRVWLNATIAGSPVYTPINGSTGDNGVTLTSANAIASTDTTGTTLTNGTVIFTAVVAIDGSAHIDLREHGLFINAGETWSFSITCTAAVDVAVAANWSGDL